MLMPFAYEVAELVRCPADPGNSRCYTIPTSCSEHSLIPYLPNPPPIVVILYKAYGHARVRVWKNPSFFYRGARIPEYPISLGRVGVPTALENVVVVSPASGFALVPLASKILIDTPMPLCIRFVDDLVSTRQRSIHGTPLMSLDECRSTLALAVVRYPPRRR